MNIGWLAFGKMGEPMALRMTADGNGVPVFDVSDGRRAAARVVESLGGPLASADAIVSSLLNDAVAPLIPADAGSPLQQEKPGALLIETSIISVGASASIADTAATRQFPCLQVPISGSVMAAANGMLTTFISGHEALIKRAWPIVSTYSTTIRILGNAKQARVMRLAVNLMVTTLVVGLGEVHALWTKGGIAPKDDGCAAMRVHC